VREKRMAKRRYRLMDIHNRLETIKGKKFSEMNLFELSIVSAMTSDVYGAIRRQVELALTYLEDGATNTAAAVLQKFLNH
jgi:glycerate-2-kinase